MVLHHMSAVSEEAMSGPVDLELDMVVKCVGARN